MKKYIILILVLILMIFLPQRLKADSYLYSDSLRLMVATYDTAYHPTLTNADSVVWYRVNYSGSNQRMGVQTTGDIGTGIYSYKIAACSASSVTYIGSYSAYAKVYKSGYTGGKTWTWKSNNGLTINLDNAIGTLGNSQIDDDVDVNVKTVTNTTWELRGLHLRGTTGADTAFIASGYGYGMGLFISGGSTGADAIYALGGGTGAGLHAKGGSGDGAEGIFAEGTGTGPGTYSLGGSSGAGLQVIGQGAGSGIKADGGATNADGIKATGFGSASGIRAIKGSTGYDIYGNIYGSISRTDSITGTGKLTQAQKDSLMFGRWRASGDSSNVLVDLENDTLWHSILTGTQAFNMTGNITGNLSGSVGSVTGNVGGSVASVTGAVGSVTGAVGSVTSRVHTYNTDSLGYVLYVNDFRNNDTVYSSNAGTGLDSATTSRILRRIGWGLGGNGSDSTTIAERTVTGAGGGSCLWTQSQIDSMLFGKWRVSGDNSNVLVNIDQDTFKKVIVISNTDKINYGLSAVERDSMRNFDKFSGTLATSQFEAGYFAISNFTGTWASTQFSAGYYHNIALASDSGAAGGGGTDWTSAQRDTILWAVRIIKDSLLTGSDSFYVKGGFLDSLRTAIRIINAVTVGTNNDKTEYSLTQSFPSNFASMKISSGGYISPNFSDIYGTLDSSEFSQYCLTTWHFRTAYSTLTTSDNIGINWADVSNPTTTLNLSGTSISTSQVIARADSVTGVGRVTTLNDANVLHKTDSTIIARAPWDNDLIAQASRRIQYAESTGNALTALDFWNVAFNSSFTAGSMGDSLNNASYVQGAASGLTAQSIWEYALSSAFDDAGDSNQAGHQLRHSAHILAESTFSASDTTDTLKVKFDATYWHKLALSSDSGGSASSNWSDEQRDSILNAIADAGKLGNINTKVNVTLDDSFGVVKSRIYSYLDEAISGIDDNPWDAVSRTLTEKSGFSLTSDYLTKSDSGSTGASYLRTKYLEDKTGIALTSAYLTKADSGSSGASYLRAKYIEDKTEYRLSAQGVADIYIEDTTGINSGFALLFKAINEQTQKLHFTGSPDSVIASAGCTGGSSDTTSIWSLLLNHAQTIAQWMWQDTLVSKNSRYVRRADTTGYLLAGAGAGASASEIADTLLNRGYLFGAGWQVCSLIVLDQANSPVPNLPLQIKGWTGVPIGTRLTGATGVASFLLDTTNYKVHVYSAVYPQVNTYDTFAVRASHLYDTVRVTSSTPHLCNVYGLVAKLDGTGDSGAIVTAKIKRIPLKYGNTIISPYEKRDTTNSEGQWSMNLFPDTLLTPSGTHYEFIIYKTNGMVWKDTSVVIPDSTSWQLR